MDDAFVRRMRFIIDFPFPDEGLRERIWRRIFPSPAPLSPDVDHRFLARRLDFAGGNIRNVSVRAAYLAASQGRPIEMEDLILAAKREFKKMGRLYNESKLGSYRKTGVEAFASGDRT